jgi:hypothetical protein
MFAMRKSTTWKYGIAAATLMLCSHGLFAQEVAAEGTEEDEDDTIEEIIVVAPRPGSRRRVHQEYEDPVRAKLLKDFYKMQEDKKELEWRAAAAEESPDRVSWGYDTKDEYQIRKQMDLMELPSERTKPATIFKVTF